MKEAEGRAGGPKVDFGFERVRPAEKRERVKEVFDVVADRYDLMNDLMSFGLHRAWKRLAVALGRVRTGQRVLDRAVDEVRVLCGVEGIAQHHREAEERGDRVGQAPAGDVGRGPVHRLVERLALPALVGRAERGRR